MTGGADGLFGFEIAPVFGVFSFDLAGQTAYWYGAGVMAVVFFLSKALVNSPFGLAVKGIRENPVRMRMLGVPVTRRLVALYAISGAFAAVAGGLSAQVTKLVGLDSLTFTLSGNVLVMLILGGTGSLYGAFLGAFVFVVLSDRAAAISPFHWLFAIGIVLILAVRYAPQGLVGLIETLAARAGYAPEPRVSVPALAVEHVSKSFGALRVARGISLTLEPGARHALIGPNGAGKTTLVNLVSGLLQPSEGVIRLDGVDITNLSPERRVGLGPGPHLPDQLALPAPSVAENVALALAARLGTGRRFWGSVRARPELMDGTARASRQPRAARARAAAGRRSSLWPAPAGRDRARAGARAQDAAARRAGGGARRVRPLRPARSAAAPAGGAHHPGDRARHEPRLPPGRSASPCWSRAAVLVEGAPAEIRANRAGARRLSRDPVAWLTAAARRRDRGLSRHHRARGRYRSRSASEEAWALLGRNGVGKTTLLATVMGLTVLRRGRICLGGEDITVDRHPSARPARVGLVPQEREIFPSLTVDENLRVATPPGRMDARARL